MSFRGHRTLVHGAGVLGFEALVLPCPSLSSFLKAQPCMSVTVVMKEEGSSVLPWPLALSWTPPAPVSGLMRGKKISGAGKVPPPRRAAGAERPTHQSSPTQLQKDPSSGSPRPPLPPCPQERPPPGGILAFPRCPHHPHQAEGPLQDQRCQVPSPAPQPGASQGHPEAPPSG